MHTYGIMHGIKEKNKGGVTLLFLLVNKVNHNDIFSLLNFLCSLIQVIKICFALIFCFDYEITFSCRCYRQHALMVKESTLPLYHTESNLWCFPYIVSIQTSDSLWLFLSLSENAIKSFLVNIVFIFLSFSEILIISYLS